MLNIGVVWIKGCDGGLRLDPEACLEGEVGYGAAVSALDCMDAAVECAEDDLEQAVSINVTGHGTLQGTGSTQQAASEGVEQQHSMVAWQSVLAIPTPTHAILISATSGVKQNGVATLMRLQHAHPLNSIQEKPNSVRTCPSIDLTCFSQISLPWMSSRATLPSVSPAHRYMVCAHTTAQKSGHHHLMLPVHLCAGQQAKFQCC